MSSARSPTRPPLVLIADAPEWVSRALETQLGARADADHAWAEGLVDAATQLSSVRGLARRVRELGAGARRRAAPLACVAFTVEEEAGQSAERVTRLLREAARTSDAVGR